MYVEKGELKLYSFCRYDLSKYVVKRDGICKSMKKKKKFGHMKVQEENEKNRDTWRSQGVAEPTNL